MAKTDKPAEKAASKTDKPAAPEGQVWMSKGSESTLVSDDASVEIMTALGWSKD